ncbi:hypothetical protein ABMY26_06615 (plasmid) [Azospirillum sp. HJ39]|uniref:hypothetical protein n=1 Tax=Azospirillum sp. HJ39 TaxID=3159496 RepID=UPI0035573549
MQTQLTNVGSQYGAPMGRPSKPVETPSAKITLRKIRINGGGYDSGGAYWGIGQPLYWAGSDDGKVDMFFRAKDRDAAKDHVRSKVADAKFYR